MKDKRKEKVEQGRRLTHAEKKQTRTLLELEKGLILNNFEIITSVIVINELSYYLYDVSLSPYGRISVFIIAIADHVSPVCDGG